MPQAVRPVAALLIALASLAQAQEAPSCAALDPARPQDAYRAFDCVSRLDAELSAARARLAQAEAHLDQLERRLAALDPSRLLGPVNERLDALTVKLATASAVPAHRAVVAFTPRPDGQPCPDHWHRFEGGQPPSGLTFCVRD